MKTKMAVLLGKPAFEKMEIDNWIELFEYFVEFNDATEKVIFIIDEFPYLIELNRGITSIFQHIWDEILVKQNVMLILTGSSVGMMENEVLGYRSPLYGRRTGQWKVTEMTLKQKITKLLQQRSGTAFHLTWDIDLNYYVKI